MRLLILLLPVFFFSCRTIKEVVKIETVYDSTAIRENEKLQKAYQEMVETYEKERESWEKTGVVFETDCDTSARTVTKIIYDNGKLKSIEGRVKSLNIDLIERTEELYDAHRTIDELQSEIEMARTDVNTVERIVTRDVERKVLPWWIWLIPIAWFGREIIPWVRKRFFLK